MLNAFQMEQEAPFRGPYRGAVSRVCQGYGADEVQEEREMGGVGGSALPRSDGGRQHRAENDAYFHPKASSSPPKRNPAAAGGAAAEGSNPYADYAVIEGGPASATHTEFSVEVSYLEIYNESLRDLFNPATPAAGSHGGNVGGSSGEWGGGMADKGGGGGGGGGGVSIGNSLRLREDPT